MAKKYNPSVIGGFVLGGIVLLIGALFLFGSGDLFKEKRRWVTYFDGSVGGLSVGAPVNFRGVRVGTVTDVRLQIDTSALTARIPVYFEIDPGRVDWIGGPIAQSPELAAQVGVRAKLGMQSLVTGQMQVELDIMPDTPPQLVGADPNTPEIPSAKSEFDVLREQISELPLRDVLNSIDRAVNDIDRLVNSPETRDSLRALAASLGETEKLIGSLNEGAQPLLRELTSTAQSVHRTSDQANMSLQAVEGDLRATLGDVRQLATSVRGDLKTTLRSADQALQQARTTLASVDGLVANDTGARADIDRTLENLAQASTALRSFADKVERNPNAIIVGR